MAALPDAFPCLADNHLASVASAEVWFLPLEVQLPVSMVAQEAACHCLPQVVQLFLEAAVFSSKQARQPLPLAAAQCR
jgi:hypothetical protein